MADTQTNQFQMLRARIETALKPPYALLISSATLNDGKSVCAHGLAASMAAAGHSTLLIDLDHESTKPTGLPQLRSLSLESGTSEVDGALVLDAKSKLSMISLAHSSLSATASKENVAAFIAYLRTKYDSIVIDAARITQSSIGTLFSSECDAVILTAREGRSIKAEDRATLEALERENANFFGVVTIGARTIADFTQRSYTPSARQTSLPLVSVAKTESPLAKSLVI